MWPHRLHVAQRFRLLIREHAELIGNGHPCGPHFVSALFACRQIHAEAALLPLQLNEVRIVKFQTTHQFLARLTEDQRNAIRTVKILVDDVVRGHAEMATFWTGNHRRVAFDAFLPLKELGGLERLIVESTEDDEARARLREQDLRGLARQYGGHSGVEVVFNTVVEACKKRRVYS
jgi:hypothetical protein